MPGIIVSQLAAILQLQPGQTVIYENLEMDVLKTVLYRDLKKGIGPIPDDDPFAKRHIHSFMWSDKVVIIAKPKTETFKGEIILFTAGTIVVLDENNVVRQYTGVRIIEEEETKA